jgi:steroid 5-alpha reductase family enzyme
MTPYLMAIGLSLAFVVVEMSATWMVAGRLRNYGIVDVVWSFGFLPLALLHLAVGTLWRVGPSSGGTAAWNPVPALVITALVGLWSLRLGLHLYRRVAAHHPVEDVRYAALREEWGQEAARKMYRFYLLQGLIQVVLALPFVWVSLDSGIGRGVGGLGWTGVAGLVLWAIGIGGESVADRQLARFRGDPSRRGQVCQEGLWRWSRHPNYFFEWLVWVGYAVFAGESSLGGFAWLSPLLMYHFLVNVTGIPMTEALSVKSKGDAYRRYQRTTSAFFPRPPRSDSEVKP